MDIHHTGILVSDINSSSRFYQDVLKFKAVTLVVYDPIQDCQLQMLSSANGVMVELIQPASQKSPLYALLQRRSEGPVHICYSTREFDQELNMFRNAGLIPIGRAVPALLFENRRVCFFMAPTHEIIEILEM